MEYLEFLTLSFHGQPSVKVELIMFELVFVKFRKLRTLYRENKSSISIKIRYFNCLSHSLSFFNWTKAVFKYFNSCFRYSLLYIIILDVFCSTIWNLVEYKLLFPVAILCCILTWNYNTNRNNK